MPEANFSVDYTAVRLLKSAASGNFHSPPTRSRNGVANALPAAELCALCAPLFSDGLSLSNPILFKSNKSVRAKKGVRQ